MIDYPLPLIGFSAYSGTGKTTLLKHLVPLLRQQGLRIAVIKHAHHRFDIDQPGKDSHTLREAGANQILIASRRRVAMVSEYDDNHGEPTLDEVLGTLTPDNLDLVLVEGFKRAAIPKIELHRPALGKPLLCLQDTRIIAIATDTELPEAPETLPRLDINNPQAIANFILRWMAAIRGTTNHEPTAPAHRRQLC